MLHILWCRRDLKGGMYYRSFTHMACLQQATAGSVRFSAGITQSGLRVHAVSKTDGRSRPCCYDEAQTSTLPGQIITEC